MAGNTDQIEIVGERWTGRPLQVEYLVESSRWEGTMWYPAVNLTKHPLALEMYLRRKMYEVAPSVLTMGGLLQAPNLPVPTIMKKLGSSKGRAASQRMSGTSSTYVNDSDERPGKTHQGQQSAKVDDDFEATPFPCPSRNSLAHCDEDQLLSPVETAQTSSSEQSEEEAVPVTPIRHCRTTIRSSKTQPLHNRADAAYPSPSPSPDSASKPTAAPTTLANRTKIKVHSKEEKKSRSELWKATQNATAFEPSDDEDERANVLRLIRPEDHGTANVYLDQLGECGPATIKGYIWLSAIVEDESEDEFVLRFGAAKDRPMQALNKVQRKCTESALFCSSLPLVDEDVLAGQKKAALVRYSSEWSEQVANWLPFKEHETVRDLMMLALKKDMAVHKRACAGKDCSDKHKYCVRVRKTKSAVLHARRVLLTVGQFVQDIQADD